MVTLTADVTKGIKEMTAQLIKTGMYKSQSEVVRDAIRQLAYRYNIQSVPGIDEVRSVIGRASEKSSQTLSGTVRQLRDDV